jgi:hypothetical protein
VKINLPGVNIREDGPSRIPTYKDIVKKETESLNDEIIEKKLKEKLESIILQLKKNYMHARIWIDVCIRTWKNIT